jgi:CHAT domain-containing protein
VPFAPLCLAQTSQPIGKLTGQALELTPGKSLSLDIPAGERHAVSFTLCSGCFAEIRIEHLRWMISAYVSGPDMHDGLPRTSDAGLHSIIHIPVIGTADPAWTLEIAAAVPNSAAVRVTMTTPRPALTEDRLRVEGSNALARGEWQRRAGGTSGAPAAIASYDAAIATAQRNGDTHLEALALLGKARVFLYRTGDYRAGLKTSLEAMTLVKSWNSPQEPREDLALDAFAWKVLSSSYYFLAEYPEMIDATNQSLALYRNLGDRYWEGILEGNVSNVYMETGDMQHALSAGEGALAVARELSDDAGVAFTQATLAMIHQRRGEYEAAFEADRAALDAMSRKPDADEQGQVWTNLAELYDELRDRRQEREALHQSLPLLRQSGDTSNQTVALCDLGLLDVRQRDLKNAAISLDEAMRIATSHGLAREQALVWLGKAELLATQSRVPEALAAIHSGQILAAQTNEVATSALLAQEEGDVQARSGHDSDALIAYRKAESVWSGIPNLEHAALARASIARLEFQTGDIYAAHNDVVLALNGFEASRRNIGGRSLRESFFASVHDFYDLAVTIDMRRAQQDPAAAEEAWQIAERARARSLVDAIRASTNFSTHNLPAPLLERSATLERNIATVQQTIARLQGASSDAGALRQAADQLHTLVLQAEEAESTERELSTPSLFVAGMHPPSLADVRSKLLAPDAALLEYWVGRHDVELWIITADSMRSLHVSRTSRLEAAVRGYREALLAREEFPANEGFQERRARIDHADAALERQASLLGGLLLPIHLPDAVHRLLIVPDGELASVPFATLRLASQNYLVQRFEIAEEPSASAAMELLARPASAVGENRIAVFADPVYNFFDPRLAEAERTGPLHAVASRTARFGVLRAGFDLDLSELPRLNASSVEARAIASIAGPQRVSTFLGFQATPETVMELPWSKFAIAHFATHAIVDSAHPELSGIVLSTLTAKGARQNGVLWLHDIYRTPIPVSLVVLSGCGTANGKSIPGEGISGLAQAFLSSGASGVIGTLWSVDDHAAGEMIPWFYRALLDRHFTIAGALRAAQLHMLTLHQPPYDWAGYVIEGNGGAAIGAPFSISSRP